MLESFDELMRIGRCMRYRNDCGGTKDKTFKPIKIESIMCVCWNTECNYEMDLDFVQQHGLTTCPKCGESLGRDERE